jgi:hypothetical protein
MNAPELPGQSLFGAQRKLFTHHQMVIDLPIENQDITPASGNHWLVPCGRKVDDGQSAMRKRNSSLVIRPIPYVIRPSMAYGLRHIP